MNQSKRQGGALMIEVLVTIVIVIIGLMGLMEMQSRLHKSEVESYQRTQALMLLNDMADRIAANRAHADKYTAADIGVGTCTDPNSITVPADPEEMGAYIKDFDQAEWCMALQGAGELDESDKSIGAMIGGRGCIQDYPPNYLVTVVWQGLTPISAPPGDAIVCGEGNYDEPTGSDCAAPGNEEKCRRYVSTIVRVADMSPPI